MGLLDRLLDVGQSVLSLDKEIRRLQAEIDSIHEELHSLTARVQDQADRVTRLETQRAANRAEWDARFALFQAELKQTLAEFELRLKAPKKKPRRK